MGIVFIPIIVYILLTLFVGKRINKADYIKEEGRRLHQIQIWLLPFVSPGCSGPFGGSQNKKKPRVMTRSLKKADNPLAGKALGMLGIGFTGGDIIVGGGGADGGGDGNEWSARVNNFNRRGRVESTEETESLFIHRQENKHPYPLLVLNRPARRGDRPGRPRNITQPVRNPLV